MRPPTRALLVTAAGVLVLAGCASGSTDDTAAGTTTSSSAPSTATTTDGGTTTTGSPSTAAPGTGTPVPVTPAPGSAGCSVGSVVQVSDADGLQEALDDVVPGQTIQLADGTYEGNFYADVPGTADAPIALCGSRGAILDGGSISGDYTLHLDGVAHWTVAGLTVTGGQKGVMLDGVTATTLEQLLVTSMGDEAIHLRSGSSDNVVRNNTIRDTGQRKPQFGEGIYVGTAESNWCSVTDCEPDRSDRNLIEGNTITGTTAESVDIKEGTSDGILRGNTFDGSDMVEADSWVDVKGNGWLIEGNTGTGTTEDGFQVHEVVDGWGQDTVFRGNTSDVGAGGFAINVAGPRVIRETTTVACSNTAEGAASGLSNVTCT